MWFKVVLIVLSVSHLGLAAPLESDGVAREELNSTLEKHLAAAVEEVITNVTTSCICQQPTCICQYPLGSTPSYPAAACWEIQNLNPTAPSGYYWLRGTDGSSFRMYCDMSMSCEGVSGGWMQVAKIDMNDTNETCPEGLRLLTTPKRLCGMDIGGGGCSPATFKVNGIQYTNVCGKIIGYQQRSPDAFNRYVGNRGLTIDDQYVDGISLTHGLNPRKHIWTFAAALDEVISSSRYICPCINNNTESSPIPPYVGSDYFCDTGSETNWEYRFYPDDPLWDGQGCGRSNTCCSFNNPPWFMKELSSSTADDIEMRLCADEGRGNEDVPVEVIELYVQ